MSRLPDLCLLSYLPLAHIYEVIIMLLYASFCLIYSFQRVVELTVIVLGGCIGFFTGDPLRLLEDAQFLKPHLFPAVPRVLNRVYQSAMAAGSAPGLKGALFRMAVQTKLDQLHKTGVNTHPLWDFLVFSKARNVPVYMCWQLTFLCQDSSSSWWQCDSSQHGFSSNQCRGDRFLEDCSLL